MLLLVGLHASTSLAYAVLLTCMRVVQAMAGQADGISAGVSSNPRDSALAQALAHRFNGEAAGRPLPAPVAAAGSGEAAFSSDRDDLPHQNDRR